MSHKNSLSVLVVEDDCDDQLLIKDAFLQNGILDCLRIVNDGEELMDYLLKRNTYEVDNCSYPSLILLDLNLPKKNGREAIQEIRKNKNLKKIPVVILSTSNAEKDVKELYELGANSFIVKPSTFDALVNIVDKINEYWLNIVKLPPLSKVN